MDGTGGEQFIEGRSEGEGDAGQSHQGQSDEHRAAGAETGGGAAAGQATEERSGGIGGDQRAGPRLAEMKLAREVREQRGEGRVEHGVHEHEYGDQQQQTAHPAKLSAPGGRLGRRLAAPAGTDARVRGMDGSSAASAPLGRWSEGSGWLFDRERRNRTAVVVGLLGAFALAVLGVLVRHEPVPRGDDRIYEEMARDPFGTHTFPFGYRIGLPLLVHVLPFGSTTGFLLLAWLAAGGAAAFAYLLMSELGAPSAWRSCWRC